MTYTEISQLVYINASNVSFEFLINGYEVVPEWGLGKLLCEDKTHITGLTVSDPDILLPKYP